MLLFAPCLGQGSLSPTCFLTPPTPRALYLGVLVAIKASMPKVAITLQGGWAPPLFLCPKLQCFGHFGDGEDPVNVTKVSIILITTSASGDVIKGWCKLTCLLSLCGFGTIKFQVFWWWQKFRESYKDTQRWQELQVVALSLIVALAPQTWTRFVETSPFFP
jgi:hypothetical protein